MFRTSGCIQAAHRHAAVGAVAGCAGCGHWHQGSAPARCDAEAIMTGFWSSRAVMAHGGSPAFSTPGRQGVLAEQVAPPFGSFGWRQDCVAASRFSRTVWVIW